MRRTGIFVVCCAILSSQTASAQIKLGRDAPEIEAGEWLNIDTPIVLSDLEGMVVVLYFWVSFHQGGERMIGLVNAIENNVTLGRSRGVAVIGLTEAAAKQVQPMLESEKVFFPVGVGSETHKRYQVSRFPWVVIVDAKGKVAYSGVATKGQELINKVQETLVKTPPTRTHPLEAPKVHQKLEAARASLRTSSYRAAFRHARDAFETAVTGDQLKTQCEEMLELLEAIGDDRLADVDQMVERKNFEKIVETLQTVGREFKGTDVSRSARRRLVQLGKEYKQVAALLKVGEKDDEARAKLYTAQQLLHERRLGEAYAAMQQVAKDFAGTETAAASMRIMSRMKANEAVMTLVRDHLAARECKGWLSQARSLARTRSGRLKAKRLYRQIISKYPDTTYADEATKALAKLR